MRHIFKAYMSKRTNKWMYVWYLFNEIVSREPSAPGNVGWVLYVIYTMNWFLRNLQLFTNMSALLHVISLVIHAIE